MIMPVQEETVEEETGHECLRPPHQVLTGTDMNGAWATRHSFARTMLRRARSQAWHVEKTRLDFDAQGRGTAVYTVYAEGRIFSFIAFSRTLDESQRTDRVIADAWDVTAALLEGRLTSEREEQLRQNVPVQEKGRPGADAMVLTRANRSLRFFDYVGDCLARGQQPDVHSMGPSPYVLRSTAFYSNGKFGLKEFADFPAGHPLGVPYRAQMLAAWLLRELSIDLVEHVARAKADAAGTQFVPLDPQWGKYLGLGNATGLGMVPFVVNHPEYLDAWCRLREIPLSRALMQSYSPDHPDLERIVVLLTRACGYLEEKRELKTAPFLDPPAIRSQLGGLLAQLRTFINTSTSAEPILAHLHEKAARLSAEARGILASIVIELRSDFDDEAEVLLTIGETAVPDAGMRCAELRRLLAANYGWVRTHDFGDPSATGFFWFSATANEEPRRGRRAGRLPGGVEHCTDIAQRIARLNADLARYSEASSVAEFLRMFPEHRFAVHRVQQTQGLRYPEIHDNLLAEDFLPLSVQRFQLAVYGMNNFSPQSTDWLRVTLFSGAPRTADLGRETSDADDWLFPLAPPSKPSLEKESRP